MRIKKEEALYIAVDYQKKLLPVIEHQEEILKKTNLLIRGLQALEVPMLTTTQYAKGLGENEEAIQTIIGADRNFDKVTFSLYQDETIKRFIDEQQKRFVIISGVETHICILQSLIDLKAAGYIPVLVVDCSGARKATDHQIGIQRAVQEGVLLTSAESLLYELAVTAKAAAFKTISNLVKEQD